MKEQFNGPLFIVGLSRSGTKLIRDLINRNDYVSIPEVESHFIPPVLQSSFSLEEAYTYISNSKFVKRFPETTFPSMEELRKVRDINTKQELIEAVLKFYTPNDPKEFSNGLIWGDKTPLYLRSLDLLKANYPTSKVIHIIRDPRDRAISVKKTWNKSMMRATEKWRNELENIQKWRDHNDFYHELMYEDLVADTKGELLKICDFLNIKFQDKMLELTKPSEKYGDNKSKLSVNKNNTAKYLNFKKSKIKRVEEIALPMLKEYGYDPIYAKKFVPFSKFMNELLKYSDFIFFTLNNKLKGY